MHIRSLEGKRICILGFGREGQATLPALQKYAPGADITVADRNGEAVSDERSAVRLQLGTMYLDDLDRFDVIIKSPGIPLSSKLKAQSLKLTSATQIFLDTIADTGATVIGVTGSKGKSTTASLIYEILRAAPHPPPVPNGYVRAGNPLPKGEGIMEPPLPAGEGRGEGYCYLIGNIGMPALDFLDKAKPGVTFVIELSSYQLMDLTVSPHIAIITSLFPEHLDYHGSLEAYKEAKCHIVKFQTKNDIVFYSSAFSPSPRGRGQGEGPYEISMLSPGKKVPFSENDAPVNIEEIKLIGQHNLSNIAGAWKVAEYLGIPRNIAVKAIKEFPPLPHRLQSLGIHHNIEWVDDAISTTPESTIAALDALGDRVVTIILGGQDRGNDFTELARRLKNSSVKTIILFPGSGPRIRAALEVAGAKVRYFEASNMEEAVTTANNEATNYSLPTTNSPVVLLSTASPSYNMFKNFEEKGEKFTEEILRTPTTL